MDNITKIINDWDPINLFPMAPEDEYINEIKRIKEYLHSNQNVQIQSLAEEIHRIFMKAFEVDVYIERCAMAAYKILNSRNKKNEN